MNSNANDYGYHYRLYSYLNKFCSIGTEKMYSRIVFNGNTIDFMD